MPTETKGNEHDREAGTTNSSTLYNEDKPLFLGHRLSVLHGTTPKTIFPGDNLDFIKKENKIKTNIVFNWRTHVTKNFDVIKLKAQPKTPEIHVQRISLSLIKPFLLGQRNYNFYQYSENVLAIIKIGLE